MSAVSRRTRARWFLRRAFRRTRARLLAPVYWDRLRDPAHAVAVVGTARSGTTWLGGLLANGLGARIVFEPLHPVHVPRAAKFGLMPFRAPQDDDPELEAFCRDVFSGALRGWWIDRQAARLLPTGRVVKSVRANLMLGWLRRRFPEVPTVLLVRHPAAVVLSRMEAGWPPAMDVDAMLADERLVAAHLADHIEWARTLRTTEARHALVWGIHYLVATAQHRPDDGTTVVFYEDLVNDPAGVLGGIYARIGRTPADASPRALRRPSPTARIRGSARVGASPHRWLERLSRAQTDQVREVVERLELDWVYGSDRAPRGEARKRLHATGLDRDAAATDSDAAARTKRRSWQAVPIATAED
jgi:hypothetical protein